MARLRELLLEAKAGLEPWETIPDVVLDDVAARCGAGEVAEAIAALDKLAKERPELPAWDGDAADDIANAQTLYARLLAQVPGKFLVEIARGLDSPYPETRFHVANALATRGAATLPLLSYAYAREDDAANREAIAEFIRVLEG